MRCLQGRATVSEESADFAVAGLSVSDLQAMFPAPDARQAERVLLIPVSGTSMEPTLHPGEQVEVLVPARRTGFGDILLIRHREIFFLHRLVGRKGGALRTKGDGRAHFDGWLSRPEEVEGCLLQVRRGGRARAFRGGAARPLGWLAGVWSALCGHLYRLALRLDREIGGGTGNDFRDDAVRLNWAGFLLIEAIASLLAPRPAA